MNERVLLLDWLCDYAEHKHMSDSAFGRLYNAAIQASYRGTILTTLDKHNRRWAERAELARWVAKYEGKKAHVARR